MINYLLYDSIRMSLIVNDEVLMYTLTCYQQCFKVDFIGGNKIQIKSYYLHTKHHIRAMPCDRIERITNIRIIDDIKEIPISLHYNIYHNIMIDDGSPSYNGSLYRRLRLLISDMYMHTKNIDRGITSRWDKNHIGTWKQRKFGIVSYFYSNNDLTFRIDRYKYHKQYVN